MTKQIVVGYDGSVASVEAARWAATEAKMRRVQLRIVSCFEVPLAGEVVGGWAATETYDSLLQATQSSLAEMQHLVSESAPELDIVTEAIAGPTAWTLVDCVDPEDLIVLGASGHRGATAILLGSTPRYVVRHSPCPVVVVRAPASRGRPDRVVVGIDGSMASAGALQWAGDEADLHDVGLVIVHAWLYPYLPIDTASSRVRDLTNVDAACVLDREVELARDRFRTEVTGQLVESGPASALLETVRDGDLLVVGSRGRGALASNLFGSTVNTVLDRCAVPVVVVRGLDDEE